MNLLVNITMWELMVFMIHVLTLAGVIYLWRGAPDKVQKIAHSLLIIAMLGYLSVDFVRMFLPPDVSVPRELFRAASLPMQFAILLYVGRWVKLKREEKCRHSLQRSSMT